MPDNICCYCKNECTNVDPSTNEYIAVTRLHCDHSIHGECIQKLVRDTYPEYLDCISINKKEKYGLDKKQNDKFHTMHLGIGNSGIVHYPTCAMELSLLSPFYQEFGYPNKIMSKIFFDVDSNPCRFDICTNLDMAHLLQGCHQSTLRTTEYR